MPLAETRTTFQSENKETQPRSSVIYLVRHGESQENAGIPYSGSALLTEKGIEQARILGDKFRNKGVKFDVVVTSGRPRAEQTAKYVLDILGQKLPFESNENLREKPEFLLDKQTGQRLPDKEAEAREEKKSLPDEKRWDYKPSSINYNVDKFETEREAANRLRDAISEIVKKHPGKKVLIVSHGRSMRAFLASLQKQTDEKDSAFESVYNGGFAVLEAKVADGELSAEVVKKELNWSKESRSTQDALKERVRQLEDNLNRVRLELDRLKADTQKPKAESASAKKNDSNKETVIKVKEKIKKIWAKIKQKLNKIFS